MRRLITVLSCAVIVSAGLTGCGGGDGGNDGAALSSEGVGSTAVSDLGGEAEAGTAILMAMAKGESLEDIVAAIMAGTLDAYGNIDAASGRRLQASSVNLYDICDYPDDSYLCHMQVRNKLQAWETRNSNSRLAVIILRMAARGYDADQITVAISAMVLGTPGLELEVSASGEIYQTADTPYGPQDFPVLPNEPVVSIFTDVSVASGDGETDDGWDESFDDLTGQWSTTGSCPGGDSAGYASMTGTTTLRADGTASVDWQYYKTDGSRGAHATVSADWTYSSGRLTLMVSATYTGAARPEFTRMVLSSEGCWSLTLTR